MPGSPTPAQREAIAALLELLPAFEDGEFVPAVWPPWKPNDKGVFPMPYPPYHPLVEEFIARARRLSDGIHPYDALPEDERPGGVQFNVMGTSYKTAWFETATLDQIRRYFVLMNRGERFADGHIEGEFRAGKVVAAMHRLASLLRESG